MAQCGALFQSLLSLLPARVLADRCLLSPSSALIFMVFPATSKGAHAGFRLETRLLNRFAGWNRLKDSVYNDSKMGDAQKCLHIFRATFEF